MQTFYAVFLFIALITILCYSVHCLLRNNVSQEYVSDRLDTLRWSFNQKCFSLLSNPQTPKEDIQWTGYLEAYK